MFKQKIIKMDSNESTTASPLNQPSLIDFDTSIANDASSSTKSEDAESNGSSTGDSKSKVNKFRRLQFELY